jgi:hypothetical protein
MTSDRQLLFYKVYAGFASAAIAILVLAVFQVQFPRHQKFDEIDVQRINVLEPDGKLDMVISNKARIPDPVVAGKTGHRSDTSPGMLFYNGQGDENGGLTFSADVHGGNYEASAGLLFDQYKQDQTVGVVYEDQNGQRRAGLAVWDRPDTSLALMMGKMEALKSMNDSDRQKAIAGMKARGELGVTRLFVGKEPARASVLVMSDEKGDPRLKISVSATGIPSLVFMDAQGNVAYTLPPKGTFK